MDWPSWFGRALWAECPKREACLAWLRARWAPRLNARGLLPPGLDRHLAGEAWEALMLQGLIPMAWASDPQRRFHATSPVDGAWLSLERPVSVRLCLALAADMPGVLHAEALAWECLERLRAWAVPQPSVLEWRMIERQDANACLQRTWLATLQVVLYEYRREAMDRRRRDPYAAVNALGPLPAELPLALGQVATLAVLWREACRSGARVPRKGSSPLDRPEGRRFSALPDPFEPLLALVATGYVIVGVSPTRVTLGLVPLREEP